MTESTITVGFLSSAGGLICFVLSINLCQGFHHYHGIPQNDINFYSLDPSPSKENPYVSYLQESPGHYAPSDTSYFSPTPNVASYPVENALTYPPSVTPSDGNRFAYTTPTMTYFSATDNLPYTSSLAYYPSLGASYSTPGISSFPNSVSNYPLDTSQYNSAYGGVPYPSSLLLEASSYPSYFFPYQYTSQSAPYFPVSSMSTYSYTPSQTPYSSFSGDVSYSYAADDNPLLYPPTGTYDPATAESNMYPYIVSKPKYLPPAKEDSYTPFHPDTGPYLENDEELYTSKEELILYEGEPYVEEYEEEPYYDEYFQGRRILDNKGRYLLRWIVDLPAKVITFNITIQNKGWVALGLSKDDTMKNADIMIGGIKSYGAEPYLGDFFSDSSRKLYTDAQSDWILVYAESVRGITHLQISRKLDTCDPYDYPINEDLIHIIWAYGESDGYDYHFDKRGSFRAYLVDPNLKTYETPLNLWRVAQTTTLTERDTSYWCTIHKSPDLSHKSHVVEVHPFIPDTLSLTHTHHIVFWRCVAPPGMNARDIFEPLLDYPGEECDFTDNHVIPVNLCKNFVSGWAIGGEPYILPYTVGLPIGEDPDEYWMIQAHYNNPEEFPLTVTSGLDLFYTDRLRKHDGEALFIGYDLFGLYMIPPISTNFEVYGICSSDCTQAMIPAEGIEIVSALLHGHTSAKKMKLQHFRNGTELPWIMKDYNYDNTYQQWRNLYKPRVVLPGDELVMKCEYDDTWTNETVINGFATRDEMCLGIITINRRIPYFSCFSQASQRSLLGLIGVRDYEWDISTGERIVTSPRSLKGEFLSDVADSHDWTKDLRYKIQGLTAYANHSGTCPQVLIPTPQDALQPHHSLHNHHLADVTKLLHQKSFSTTQTKTQQKKMLGTVISSDADPDNILTYAKGYGVDTIMGELTGVPKAMPGVMSRTIYPYDAQKYLPERYCPHPFSEFYKYPSYSSSSGTDLQDSEGFTRVKKAKEYYKSS